MPRVVLVQPALPKYRLDFFHRIATAFCGDTRVYFSPTDMGTLTDQNLDVSWAHRLGSLRKIMPGIYWQVGALKIPMRKGDVLVLSGNPRVISTLFLLLKARFAGAKVVWWGHFWSSTSKRWRHLLRMLLMRLSHAILFYTDQEVREYRSQSRSKDVRLVRALNNGLNISEIKCSRLDYVSKERASSMLFIGRITQKANLDVALRALASIHDSQVALDVIGDGPGLESLKEYAGQLGVADRVRWHGAITDEGEIARIANCARAFMYPGEVGLSLLHGMGYGLPAIVHSDRWKHMPEVAAFEEGVTGETFSPLDAEDLAKTTVSLLQNFSKLDAYSSACIEVVDHKFNTKEMARRFMDLIHALGVENQCA